MSINSTDPLQINASPTKEFFIHMLTRDVPLVRAIVDLVDNSIDGAHRIRPDGNFSDLSVHIHVDKDLFSIRDNCGGIPVEVARNYAFRFGRPIDAPSTPGSVGQFGVGMKRTFFKMGRQFSVHSSTATSTFELDVDVDAWLSQPEEADSDGWHFQFSKLQENIQNNQDQIGTDIRVTRLLTEISQNFERATFIKELELELTSDHGVALSKGLIITLNSVPLSGHSLELLDSSSIKTAHLEQIYYPDDPTPVYVNIYAGVSPRSKEDGGWYIYCNGRMVVRADQSETTGWGDSDGSRMPKYHTDFAFFRGYVFFECKNSSLLPWTTIKTGIDADSWIFKTVREQMIEVAKPVLAFLRNLERERSERVQGETSAEPLKVALDQASLSPLGTLTTQASFVAPAPVVKTGPAMKRIQYSKPAEEVQKAMSLLKVKSLTAVGEKTFEYYMKYEGGADA